MQWVAEFGVLLMWTEKVTDVQERQIQMVKKKKSLNGLQCLKMYKVLWEKRWSQYTHKYIYTYIYLHTFKIKAKIL